MPPRWPPPAAAESTGADAKEPSEAATAGPSPVLTSADPPPPSSGGAPTWACASRPPRRATRRCASGIGSLVTSSRADEERRFDVGGEYFTGRQQPLSSADANLRKAAGAVNAWVAVPDMPGHERPSPYPISAATGVSGSEQPFKPSQLERVMRTFGAPRTFISELQGPGCEGVEAGGVPLPSGCGLDWTMVILTDWVHYFDEWYQDRDLSMLIFFILFAMQLYVGHVIVQTSLHHIDYEHENEPDNELTHELAAGNNGTKRTYMYVVDCYGTPVKLIPVLLARQHRHGGVRRIRRLHRRSRSRARAVNNSFTRVLGLLKSSVDVGKILSSEK